MLGKIKINSKSLRYIYILVFSMVLTCSSNEEDKPGVIGEEVSTISPIVEGELNAEGVAESKMFYFDKPSARILKLSLEPLAVESFLPASPELSQSNHFVLPGKDASYVVSLANKSFHVIDGQGNVQKNPLRFQGTPVSTAYDRENNIIVVYDDLQSIGIVSLDEEGGILDSWLGGPLFGGERTIRAGDLNQQGEMVLYFSDHSLGIIDLRTSLSQKSWVFKDFVLNEGFEKVDWLAAIPETDYVLVVGKTSFGVINIVSEAVMSREDLDADARIRIKSRRNQPHLISYVIDDDDRDDGFETSPYDPVLPDSFRLWTVAEDGILKKSTLPSAMLNVASSLYDKTTNIINLSVIRSDGSYFLYSLRLSDGLVLSEVPIPAEAMIAIGSTHLISVYPSSLGYVSSTRLNDQNREELRSFNIPYFQQQ